MSSSCDHEAMESAGNASIADMDGERQTYILSNYCTLRLNLQWNHETLQHLIDNVSGIKILPPLHEADKLQTAIKRQEYVLQHEKEKLSNCGLSAQSSCQRIMEHVEESAMKDPLLSSSNPFKSVEAEVKEEQNEEDDGDADVEEVEEEEKEKEKKEEKQAVLVDDGVSVISDELQSDVCYQMLLEELQKSALNEIMTNQADKMNAAYSSSPSKCGKNQLSKSIKFTWQVASRAFGLIDIITDALLLIASAHSNLWYLTLSLTISMASPYIISYSSGVQLFLFRQTFDHVEGFKKLLMFVFLLPTGILYFVFLDLADIFLHIFRWFYFVLCCRSLQQIGETEQILSEQLGMDRMNWEGFKRQRSIGQLMFESLPQFVFQTIFFYAMHSEIEQEFGELTTGQLIFSIASACCNIMATTTRLKVEAMCCKTSFISYGLNCIQARVGWVPHRERILEAATAQQIARKHVHVHKEKNSNMYTTNVTSIDYEMSFRVWCHKHSVEYDFSVTTIRYLMSALQMLNTSYIDEQPSLKINFRNSLRLLPLQDIIQLFELCQVKHIEVKSLKGGDHKYSYNWSSAIQISKSYGKDARLLAYARDDQGMPYIMKLMNLTHYNDRRKIFRDLIEHDFDLNIHDLSSNESIIYTLLRCYDYKNLKYLFNYYAPNKGVLIRLNYHNKDGISPLGVALQLYGHERKIREEAPMPANIAGYVSPLHVKYLWQILVDHGADLSFACKKNYMYGGDMSPLLFVLKEVRNKHLAMHLMAAGAQLYSKEIASLNELFVHHELAEEEHFVYHAEPAHTAQQDVDDNKLQHDDSWLAFLCRVALHCGRPIEFLTDEHGNNPLHHFINEFNSKKERKLKSTRNRLKLKRLQHLMSICREWNKEKNNDGEYPFELIVKRRDPDLFFEFADLDLNFKSSVMAKKEFVLQMIDWVISITLRITRKYPGGLKQAGRKFLEPRVANDADVETLSKLFKDKYLSRLIKWPNKWCKKDVEETSLLSVAIDRELVEVTEYLIKYWKIQLKKSLRERLQRLQEARDYDKTRRLLGLEYNRAKMKVNLNIQSRQTYMEKEATHQRRTSKRLSTSMYAAPTPSVKRARTTTKEALALSQAPPPVLRQHTLGQQQHVQTVATATPQQPPLHTIDTNAAPNSPDAGLFGVDMVHMVDRTIQANKKQTNLELLTLKRSRIEMVYSFIVESLSIADIVTDIIVVYQLIEHGQSWWITLMILFMISPYLVSHSIMCSLIDFRRDSLKLDLYGKARDGEKCCSCTRCGYRLINALALSLMTPLAIVWFTVVDVTFMVYLIMSQIVLMLSCGHIDISDNMDDLLFRRGLGMSRMQIIGYRRLRTLSQLLFETLPQILLQGWILYTIGNRNSEAEIDGIDIEGIYVSVAVAACHVVLELLIIYLDARASHMTLSHYAVVCLGARLNWVPFGHQIRAKQAQRGVVYNFECIEFQPWFFKIMGNHQYRIEYEFSPSSIKKLGEYFINLPVLSSTDAPSNPYLAPVWLSYYKRHKLPIIYLGKTCCRSLNVYAFAEFFRSADRKVTLKSARVDWTRIIFVNTPNISSNNVYLKRLCEEFINYAEIKLITQLAPLVNLNASDIKLYILHTSSLNILLLLKKYYDENIHFGLDAEIMRTIYKLMKQNKWFKLYEADPSYAKVIFLMMWYSRRTLFRHQVADTSLKFTDHPQRQQFLEQAVSSILPTKFLVMYDSNMTDIELNLWNRHENDGINKMQTVLLHDGAGKSSRLGMPHHRVSDSTSNDRLLSTIEEDDNDYKAEGSESQYVVTPDWDEPENGDGSHFVNLADEDDVENHETGFEVDFEILECFSYFQPQIEKFLIDLTSRVHLQKRDTLFVGNKTLFEFFKKVFNKQSLDFLRLIINSSWNVLQTFPIHVRFAELFGRLDPVIRRLEMVHGFGKYLLASSPYRQSNKLKPFEFYVCMDWDSSKPMNENDEITHTILSQQRQLLESYEFIACNHVLNIQTDPAYHGHTSLRTASFTTLKDIGGNATEHKMRSAVQLSNRSTQQLSSKYHYSMDDIMGISRIEIEFVDFHFEALDRATTFDEDDEAELAAAASSMGKIELFTILPQKTNIVNDKLMLNKVVLKQMTFEEVQQSADKKLIVDLYDSEVLGMFRPIYVGRDRIELMPLKLLIQTQRSSIRVTCNHIQAKIYYLLRRFKDATSMKFQNVVHQACSQQNVQFLRFIHEYQDVFDCNMVDDHFQNALHLLCAMEDPDLEIFRLVLSLQDLDVNQIRSDGKTPFALLEENEKIDVEQKNEMLRMIASMPNWRPIHKPPTPIYNTFRRDKAEEAEEKKAEPESEKDKDNIKSVLLLGCENSGRHTLLKQIQMHYAKRPFSLWEKSVQKSKITKFLIESMKTMIKHCGDREIASLSDADARHIYSIHSDELQTVERLSYKSFTALERLWKNRAVKRVFYESGEQLHLSDSVAYFFRKLEELKQPHYELTDLDIIRAPYQSEKTTLTSRSYKPPDDDLQIRWILPSTEKVLKSSDLYNPCVSVDTVIFMVSLTAFMEIDPRKQTDNNLVQSLKLFQRYCNDRRFNKTKFVVLFNKTDLLQQKIREKNSILKRVIAKNDKMRDEVIDDDDYWDWLDLVQAMFRLQHMNRTVFSYPICAVDPGKIRSILKELEDIVLQSNVPAICNMDVFKKAALVSVKWIAVLKTGAIRKDEEEASQQALQFSFDLSPVDRQKMQLIADDAQIHIDYNAMVYKEKYPQSEKSKKNVHFLISVDTQHNEGFRWAVYKRAKKLKKNKSVTWYQGSRGYWQLLSDDDNDANQEERDDDDESEHEISYRHLNGILATLHHKELRTQFDGFSIHRNPIKLCFIENGTRCDYNVSWWNMSRMSKCNAITVNNKHYLHFKSPVHDTDIEWIWFNNDQGEMQQYQTGSIDQLECSYQANLESNFPLQILANTSHAYAQTRIKYRELQSIQPAVIEEEDVEQEQKAAHVEEEEKALPAFAQFSNSNIVQDRLFNHPILTDLMRILRSPRRQLPEPSYVMRFGYNQRNQISGVMQLTIHADGNHYARNVFRHYCGMLTFHVAE